MAAMQLDKQTKLSHEIKSEIEIQEIHVLFRVQLNIDLLVFSSYYESYIMLLPCVGVVTPVLTFAYEDMDYF